MKNTILTKEKIIELAERPLEATTTKPAVELVFTEPGGNTSSFIRAGVPTVVMVAANADHPGGKPEHRGSQEEGLCHDSSMLFFVPGDPHQPGHGYGQSMGIGAVQGKKVPPFMATNLCLNGFSYRTESDESDALPVCVYDPKNKVFDLARTFTPVYVASPDFRTFFKDGTSNAFGLDNRLWVKESDEYSSKGGRSAYIYFMALQVRMTIEHALEVYNKYSKHQQKSLLLTALGGLAFGNNPKLVAAIYRVVLDEYADQLQAHHVEVTMVWPPNKAFSTDYNLDDFIQRHHTLAHACPIANDLENCSKGLGFKHPSSMLIQWITNSDFRPLSAPNPQVRMNYYLNKAKNNWMIPVCKAYQQFLTGVTKDAGVPVVTAKPLQKDDGMVVGVESTSVSKKKSQSKQSSAISRLRLGVQLLLSLLVFGATAFLWFKMGLGLVMAVPVMGVCIGYCYVSYCAFKASLVTKENRSDARSMGGSRAVMPQGASGVFVPAGEMPKPSEMFNVHSPSSAYTDLFQAAGEGSTQKRQDRKL